MPVPKHIAIIPDGNRRWAEQKGMGRKEGYAIGIQKIGDVLKWCKEKDVRMITMWGFSTDNFKRNPEEVRSLFELFKENLKKGIDKANEGVEAKDQVTIRFFGKLEMLPQDIQQMIKKAEELSAKKGKYQLNLLLSYGGREELVDAVNAIIREGTKEVKEQTLSDHLYTKGLPDPDLVIRTSGEQRLSGLMPWQTCYSEFYFSEKLWPDFSKEDLEDALEEFARRKRRYGK